MCPASSASASAVASASQTESAKEGPFCCCLLLGVLAGAVPVHRERHSGEPGVHEHHESSPVPVLRTVAPDRLEAVTQDAGAAEVGSDAGAGGELDEGSGLFEFGRCVNR